MVNGCFLYSVFLSYSSYFSLLGVLAKPTLDRGSLLHHQKLKLGALIPDSKAVMGGTLESKTT